MRHSFVHILTIQVDPSGTISRVCLMTDDAFRFRPLSNGPPSAQPATTPIIIDSVLTQFDRLCESLGDTLREVVIAIFRPGFQDTEVQTNRTANANMESQAEPDTHAEKIAQAGLVKTVSELRDQMPIMTGRQHLVFRKHQQALSHATESSYDDELNSVFESDSKHWTDISLDG